MKFKETINESLKFKEFEPGMIVSVKRTPWDDEEEYEVDSIDKNMDDEVEVTLKKVRNNEEYVVDKNEMNIIEVKEIKRPKKKKSKEKEKKKEDEKENKERDKEEKNKESDESEESRESDEQNEELELHKLLSKLR